MKEKTFIRTMLVILAFVSIFSLNSCDKVSENNYMDMLVGTWVSVEETENGVLVDTSEMETLTLYLFDDYTYYLEVSQAGAPDTELYSTDADAKFELYRNKLLFTGTYGSNAYDLDYVWEILSLSDTEMLIYGDDSYFYNSIITKFVKQEATTEE